MRTGPKRTSKIWDIPTSEIKKIIQKSKTMKEVLEYFGLYNNGSGIKTLRKRLDEENINYTHIPTGICAGRGRKFSSKAFPLKKVMIKNSTYDRGNLKKRLLKDGILKNECKICKQLPEHNNQKLVMVLDHINGVSNDHRLENLRLLCPNCNSQQKTFAGKNSKKEKKKYYCIKCNTETTYNRRYCDSCFKETRKSYFQKRRKVKNRPSQEQLLKEIEELGYCGAGRKYGVSDKAIRKWLV